MQRAAPNVQHKDILSVEFLPSLELGAPIPGQYFSTLPDCHGEPYPDRVPVYPQFRGVYARVVSALQSLPSKAEATFGHIFANDRSAVQRAQLMYYPIYEKRPIVHIHQMIKLDLDQLGVAIDRSITGRNYQPRLITREILPHHREMFLGSLAILKWDGDRAIVTDVIDLPYDDNLD